MFNYIKNLKKKVINNNNNNKEKDTKNAIIPESIIGKQCNNINHGIEDNIYCKRCLCLVCKTCLVYHENHETCKFKDIKSTLQTEQKEYVGYVHEIIEEKAALKIKNTDIFNTSVDLKYQSQVEAITNQFRNLHDQLHFKEVELKRELKSYHDDNTESFTTLLSKLEHDIENLKNYVSQENSVKTSGDLADSDHGTDEDELKKFVNHRHQLLVSKQTNDASTKYQMYSFNTSQGNNDISNISLSKEKPVNQDMGSFAVQKKESFLLYLTLQRGLERVSIDGHILGKSEIISKASSLGFPTSISYFWNETFAKGRIFLFSSGNLNMINVTDEVPTWTSIPFKCTAYDLASIFDGDEHIYIFYGYNNKEDRVVKKININTFEVTNVVEHFENLSYLNLYYHNNSIYLIGGYSDTLSWKNSIQKLNLQTRQLEYILPAKNHSISGGTFVPKLNSFFCFSWGNAFFKYDQNEKTMITQISQPKNANSNYSKLYYDGNDTIYMAIVQSPTLYIYSISDDIWDYQDLHLNSITSSSFLTIAEM